MDTLGTDIDGAVASTVFETIRSTKIWLHVYADTTFSNIKLQYSLDGSGGTFLEFYPDGVQATWTSQFTKLFDLPGGFHWRLIGDGSTDGANYYIDGHHYRLIS